MFKPFGAGKTLLYIIIGTVMLVMITGRDALEIGQVVVQRVVVSVVDVEAFGDWSIGCLPDLLME